MGTYVLHDAHQLVTCAGKAPKRGAWLRDLGMHLNASVVVEDDEILEIGPAANIKARYADRIKSGEATLIDLGGHVVMPGFVDPHTHACFAGTREGEFELRIEGKGYMDILLGGGGILSTVNKVRAASREELVQESLPRLRRMLEHGTTTVEIKSGYGLDLDNELKLLEAIRELGERSPLEVVPTFMGAHAIPPEYRNDAPGYTAHLVEKLLPAVAERKLARSCDVFCEERVFPVKEARRILEKARSLGMGLRVHADEIDAIGGTDLAVELGASSADHLLKTTDEAIGKLAQGRTMAVLLPGTAFSLMHGVYARARAMIDRGAAVALATDCNPGSCYTESMPMVMAIACTQMRMVAAEAINAATINAACALGLEDRVGSLAPGKQADLVAMRIPDYRYLPYHFGVNHVDFVMKRGAVVVDRREAAGGHAA